MSTSDDIGSGEQPATVDMRNSLTVLIQTSPVPSHPSTALLEALFRSFEKADGLLESRVVILADGSEVLPSREEEEEEPGGDRRSPSKPTAAAAVENVKHGRCHRETAENYREHLRRLERLVRDGVPPFRPRGGGSLELVQLERRFGSAPAVEAAMERHVDTPLVMVCQHDNFFVSEAPLREVTRALLTEPHGLGIGATCVHFLSTATLDYRRKVRRRYGLDLGDPVTVKGLSDPLVPLVFWYGRTHVTYSDYVRSHCLNRELAQGSHLEELLGESQLRHILKHGVDSHRAFGTYVLDQGREVLYHMSGRRVRAVDENDASSPSSRGKDDTQATTTTTTTTTIKARDPLEGSFTTARETRARVPGLAFLGVDDDHDDGPSDRAAEKGADPADARRKPFKQRCFHCGEKGHSKKFCPRRRAESPSSRPPSEIIQL